MVFLHCPKGTPSSLCGMSQSHRLFTISNKTLCPDLLRSRWARASCRAPGSRQITEPSFRRVQRMRSSALHPQTPAGDDKGPRLLLLLLPPAQLSTVA